MLATPTGSLKQTLANFNREEIFYENNMLKSQFHSMTVPGCSKAD